MNTTRRGFLKTRGMLGAGGAVAGQGSEASASEDFQVSDGGKGLFDETSDSDLHPVGTPR